MLSPSPTCRSGELGKQCAFTVALTVYSSLKLKMKGKTSVLKEVKSVKTKELSFPLKVNNYLDFLQGVLDKHGQDHYKILERKRYLFKYVPPKIKGQCVSDVMDVDNEADYQEMVGKVSSIHPSTTKIFVDMKQVEKLPSSKSGDEGDESSDFQKTSSHGATDLDSHLAQWCIKLQQLHKNECDEGWTYIRLMGPLPLTPAMILDWCHALEEGQVTLHMPPNIKSFNIANKATCLHPACKAQAARALIHPAPPATPTVDINSLTSVLLLQTLTKSSLLSSPTPVAPAITLAPPLVTPTQPAINPVPYSPLVPSPTQLSCFLHYAEVNLGICNAMGYEKNLEVQGIGLDILADAGLSVGNIIHLKRGCMNDASPHPAHKRVAYEKQFSNGGASQFSGYVMTPDSNLNDPFAVPKDYTIFYKCEVHNQWLPVPPGFSVDKSGEEHEVDLDPFYTTT
ncbi:hypothetical protein EDC04DRAFT_2598430 [Pisolithus marmoratus]|nr:hypothetical protein EDC04DRAFT_2598430 [Pisolithus marmoratus]